MENSLIIAQLAFIVLAGVSACLYFLFLGYMVFKVFRNVSAKKSALPHMSKAKRKYYSVSARRGCVWSCACVCASCVCVVCVGYVECRVRSVCVCVCVCVCCQCGCSMCCVWCTVCVACSARINR